MDKTLLLRRFFAVFSLVLALSILAFLLWMTLRNPLETGLHVVRNEQLESAANADAVLNRQVVQARLNLESESVELDAARNRFDAVSKSLALGQAGLSGLNPQVDQALSSYRRDAEDKLELVDDYAEEQRRLALLFSAMRSGGIGAMNTDAVADNQSLRESVLALVRAAAAYSIHSDAESGYEIDRASGKIIVAASELESDTDRAILSRLVDTVTSLRYTRDELQALLVGLDSVSTANSLSVLRQRYDQHFNSLQSTAKQYRQTLAVYAVALLLAFGLIAWRLRVSFSALDQVNAELQSSNVNLEVMVEERTQDLSQALEDLRMQQAQLIQSEKMASLGQMVAGVAHEINTPLGYASSNIEMVREGLEGIDGDMDAETAAEFAMLLADSEYGMKQIGELVMSLKDFSRVDRSKTELFNLNDGIDTALKICQNQIKAGVEIKRDFGELPDISCAPSQLNQVFLNLINNAVQAMNNVGTLTIRSWLDGDTVNVSFRDTGCGMDEETRAHIFEPFFTTKAVGEGTGLGLSIVFRIVEDHGGLISVESEPGAGTEFLVSLPVRKASRSENNIVVSDSSDVTTEV